MNYVQNIRHVIITPNSKAISRAIMGNSQNCFSFPVDDEIDE